MGAFAVETAHHAFSAQFIPTRGEIYTEGIDKKQSGSGQSASRNLSSAPTPFTSALIMNWSLESYSLFHSSPAKLWCRSPLCVVEAGCATCF